MDKINDEMASLRSELDAKNNENKNLLTELATVRAELNISER